MKNGHGAPAAAAPSPPPPPSSAPSPASPSAAIPGLPGLGGGGGGGAAPSSPLAATPSSPAGGACAAAASRAGCSAARDPGAAGGDPCSSAPRWLGRSSSDIKRFRTGRVVGQGVACAGRSTGLAGACQRARAVHCLTHQLADPRSKRRTWLRVRAAISNIRPRSTVHWVGKGAEAPIKRPAKTGAAGGTCFWCVSPNERAALIPRSGFI